MEGRGVEAVLDAEDLPPLSEDTEALVGRSRAAAGSGRSSAWTAVELSAGDTVCVQDCQAQNRLRGSVPVTDPSAGALQVRPGPPLRGVPQA